MSTDEIEPRRGFLRRLVDEAGLARREIRQGRFQRSMALISGFAAVVSGFEAYMQHRRGAFANRWMWTPVWLTPPVIGSAAAALVSETAARHVLPAVSVAAVIDGLIGFGYHLRGIGRMPGGLKLGQYNVVMGPPVFAPLLVGMVGLLGLTASALRPEGEGGLGAVSAAPETPLPSLNRLESQIAHGRFQKLMAGAAAGFAVLAGGEAYFEHMRGSYNARMMWTPVWVSPPMVAAATAAIVSPRAARHVLPLASVFTFLDGMAGFLLHVRGIKRMPGDLHNLAFNVTYGPPLFAPLLFSAVGLLGFIAALLGRRGD